MIGRVAQDFRESSLMEIVKAVTDRAGDALDFIENNIPLCVVDGNMIAVEEKNRLWARELGSEYAEQPISTAEVQNLVTSFYVDSREQRQRPFVQLAGREQSGAGLKFEIEPLDSMLNQRACSSFL